MAYADNLFQNIEKSSCHGLTMCRRIVCNYVESNLNGHGLYGTT